MGQMNIKDEALIAKIRRIAERRRTSATEALRIAVDAQIARDERDDDAAVRARYEAIMEAARAFREAAGGPVMSREEADAFLYDPETGLPH